MRRYVRRRWLLLGLGLASLMAGAVGLLILLSPNSGKMKAKFAYIERGMTRQEVEERIEMDRPCLLMIVSNRLCVAYRADKVDSFPPGETIWIQFDWSGQKVTSKAFLSPGLQEFSERLLNRFNTLAGRTTPYPLRMPSPSFPDSDQASSTLGTP